MKNLINMIKEINHFNQTGIIFVTLSKFVINKFIGKITFFLNTNGGFFVQLLSINSVEYIIFCY